MCVITGKKQKQDGKSKCQSQSVNLSGFMEVCACVCRGAGQLGQLRMAGYEGCLTSGRNLYRGRWCLADAFRPFSRGHRVKQVAANELRQTFCFPPPSWDEGEAGGQTQRFYMLCQRFSLGGDQTKARWVWRVTAFYHNA